MEPAVPELTTADKQSFLPAEPLPNRPPIITSTPATDVNIGELYLYQASATDPDQDRLLWSLQVSVAGLAIDPESGLIGGSIVQQGNHQLTLKVEDGQGGSDSQSFTVNVYDGPIIYTSPAEYTFTGTPYRYQFGAVDPGGLKLMYSLSEGPAGIKLDPDSGLLEWTADITGTIAIGLLATNTLGKSAAQDFILTVIPANGVMIVSTPLIEAFVSQPYEYRVSSVSQTGAASNYLLATAPSGMHIDQQTGVITWTPDTAGTFNVEVQVVRDNGYVHAQNFSVRVRTAEQMDVMFISIISELFRNLGAGNTVEAMQYLTADAQRQLGQALTDLSPFIDEVTASYTTPVRMSLHPEMAEYVIRRTVNNDTRVFTVSFLLDFNGEWKINDL